MTYCNDPNIGGGFYRSNHFHFWCSKKFDNKNEAINFLELEIINASKKFPNTKFYIQDNECKKYYLNDKWEKCEGIPVIRYCHACSYALNKPDSTFCYSCGEPLIFT